MAGVRDTVVEGIRREEAQFDLNGSDGMYGVGFADRVRADFAEADAANLTLLEQVGQGLDRGLDGDVGIASRAFEDVDGLGAA